MNNVSPDIAVLTEADLKVAHTWTDMNVIGQSVGIGEGQNYATYIVSQKLQLQRITEVKVKRQLRILDSWYPGTLVAADVFEQGELWATVVGLYGVTRDLDNKKCGHGYYSTYELLKDVEVIMKSGRDRLVVAGDLNLLPYEASEMFHEIDLFDLVDMTSSQRDPLPNCTRCNLGGDCGHLWTHKNGNANGNGVPQQIDYIFASKAMVKEFKHLDGGISSFPDAWIYSDHAPLFADFR